MLLLIRDMLACLPVRYIFSILAFLGFVFNYALRVNMNVVILAMMNHTALGEVHKAHKVYTPKDVSERMIN